MEKKAVRYLLLGLECPTRRRIIIDNNIYDEYIDSLQKANKILKIEILPVDIIKGSRLPHKNESLIEFGMYMFKFPNESRDDNRAQKITEAIISSYTLIKGPFLFEPARAFRFPTSMLKGDRFLSRDDILSLDEKRIYYDEDNSVGPSLFDRICIGFDGMASVWDITPLMMEKDFSKAMMYLRASFREFYVYPGVVPEVLGKSEESPKLNYIKAKFENALLNAFKAIEALIGEPPKNNNKFFKKLLSIGVNPKYNYGYPNYKPIYKVIREMSYVRDKKAAHGSIPKRRDITYFELMDYQFCARLIVIKNIQKRLGRAILMFPKIKD